MREPAAWLVANVDLIPREGTVLDVACGNGRNAIYLAAQGYRVRAIDRDAHVLASLPSEIATEAIDLESGEVALGSRCYSGVIVFNYLHRPLMRAIVDAVAPGGVLIYETFTTAQALRGRPRNPDFLLQPGELASLVTPLRVIRSRQGDFDGKCVASVVAMR
jgi:SAM-dependent methyltransferase